MKTRISALLIAGFLFAAFSSSFAKAEDGLLVEDHGIIGASYTLLEVTPVSSGVASGDPILLVCGNNYEGAFAINKDGKVIMDFSDASVSALHGFDVAIELCVDNATREAAKRSVDMSRENFLAMSESDQEDSCRAILELSTDKTFHANGLLDLCGILVIATLGEEHGVDDIAKMHEGANPKYCYEVGLMYRGFAWEWSRMARDLGKKGFSKAMNGLYAHDKKEFLKRAQAHLLNAGDSHCLSTRSTASGPIPASYQDRGGAIVAAGGIAL